MTARDAVREHHAEYPVWAAPAAALGCGRVVGTPTEAQVLYMEAYDQYVKTRLEPWQRRHAELVAAAEAEEREETLF